MTPVRPKQPSKAARIPNAATWHHEEHPIVIPKHQHPKRLVRCCDPWRDKQKDNDGLSPSVGRFFSVSFSCKWSSQSSESLYKLWCTINVPCYETWDLVIPQSFFSLISSTAWLCKSSGWRRLMHDEYFTLWLRWSVKLKLNDIATPLFVRYKFIFSSSSPRGFASPRRGWRTRNILPFTKVWNFVISQKYSFVAYT